MLGRMSTIDHQAAERLRAIATPTEADAAAWERMNREQQLAELTELLNHPSANTPSSRTVEQILADVRAKRHDCV